MSNLLSNACKFTPRGGRVSLCVTVDEPASQAVITVQDTVIGIAESQLARIFELFAQVDASLERSQGGLGIGLTLVRTLVQMHGGTVEASSDGIGTGSTFTVRLPVLTQQSPVDVPRSVRASRRAVRPRKILVVDDNRDSADSLSMLLTLAGHQVQTANDGLAALDTARAFRPRVVLMDIGMPKLNGYEAARDTCRVVGQGRSPGCADRLGAGGGQASHSGGGVRCPPDKARRSGRLRSAAPQGRQG
jgi:hypothetical protein